MRFIEHSYSIIINLEYILGHLNQGNVPLFPRLTMLIKTVLFYNIFNFI